MPGSGTCKGVHTVETLLAAYDPRASLAELHRARLEAQVFTEETDCWVCGRYADPAYDGTPHPWARTVDQIRPLWMGGNPYDRSNSRLAHRLCQASRNTQLRAAQNTPA